MLRHDGAVTVSSSFALFEQFPIAIWVGIVTCPTLPIVVGSKNMTQLVKKCVATPEIELHEDIDSTVGCSLLHTWHMNVSP